MKVICQREGLLQACQLASMVLPTRDIKPVLKNLKFTAEPGQATLFATDLELGLSVEVAGVTVETPGVALLPATRLIQILREARVAEMELEIIGQEVVLRGGSLEYEMPIEDSSQFPDPPELPWEHAAEITAGPLKEMIRRTAFACATDVARYTMTGVLWETTAEGAVRLVATDGRRLAMTTGPKLNKGKAQAVVVPSKAMTTLERCLPDDEEEVQVSLEPRQAAFRTGRITLTTLLVEGRFPDYKAVLPKKEDVKARIPLHAGAFASAIRQAAIMIDDETRRLSLKFTPGLLTLSARNSSSGRSRVELPLEYSGAAIETFFNPVYLLDMLKQYPNDTAMEIELVSGAHPALLRAGDEYQYLIMPLT